MRLLDSENEVILAVSRDELLLVHNAIGESLEAIDDWEYSSRTGVDADQARRVQSELGRIIPSVFGSDR